MSLSTGQIVLITVSLAAVGATTVYFITKKDEPPQGAPPKREKKTLAHAPHGAPRHFGHAPPQHNPQYQQQPQYQQPPAPYALRDHDPQHPAPYALRDHDPQHYTPAPRTHYEAPPAPHHYAPPAAPPMAHDDAPQHVDYYPTPMPPLQPTATHEWPRKMPSQDVHPSQEMTPTYWRDLATQAGALLPTSPLMTVIDAQRNLNTLHAAPHGEVLKVDNILGERTAIALSNFQEHHHIPMTGQLDPETAAAILYDVYNLYSVQAGSDVAHAHH